MRRILIDLKRFQCRLNFSAVPNNASIGTLIIHIVGYKPNGSIYSLEKQAKNFDLKIIDLNTGAELDYARLAAYESSNSFIVINGPIKSNESLAIQFTRLGGKEFDFRVNSSGGISSIGPN